MDVMDRKVGACLPKCMQCIAVCMHLPKLNLMRLPRLAEASYVDMTALMGFTVCLSVQCQNDMKVCALVA